MPFKNLEHDGFEDFAKFSGRSKVKSNKKIRQKARPSKQTKLEQEQEKYLQHDNPDLWEGDIDFDD